jgi:phosphate:Na+ symporter
MSNFFDVLGQILFILGSLGIFLFGMKIMSEALQKVAGEKMRHILSVMTNNRLKGIITGFTVTSVVQSSSATTVMVVSFVNAGLLSLLGAIGVIMGANIGTTITAWIISLLGFKLNISYFAIILVGFGLPLIFSKRGKAKSWGEFLLGFALLFIGLQNLKDSVDFKVNKDLTHISPEIFEMSESEIDEVFQYYRTNPEELRNKLIEVNPGIEGEKLDSKFNNLSKEVNEDPGKVYRNLSILKKLSALNNDNFFSVIIFLIIGSLLTIVIQSSSATMALTIVMCYNGLIPFHLGAAMVMGENIGTTITANIAALIANAQAKRAARAHLIFNVFGVVWLLVVFNLFIKGIDYFMLRTEGTSPVNNPEAIPIALSVFHTTFNITNTLFLVWFAPFIEKVVVKMVPLKEEEDELFSLKHIRSNIISTSELSIIQANKEIELYMARVRKMFDMIPFILMEKKPKKYNKLLYKMAKNEEIIDRMEKEVTNYLASIASSKISVSSSKSIKAMLKIVDELESTADVCYQIAKRIDIKNDKKIWFTQDLRDFLNKIHEKVKEAFVITSSNIENDFKNVNLEKAIEIEKEINDTRNELLQYNAENVGQKDFYS